MQDAIIVQCAVYEKLQASVSTVLAADCRKCPVGVTVTENVTCYHVQCLFLASRREQSICE